MKTEFEEFHDCKNGVTFSYSIFPVVVVFQYIHPGICISPSGDLHNATHAVSAVTVFNEIGHLLKTVIPYLLYGISRHLNIQRTFTETSVDFSKNS